MRNPARLLFVMADFACEAMADVGSLDKEAYGYGCWICVSAGDNWSIEQNPIEINMAHPEIDG